jgi:hypothetical protein
MQINLPDDAAQLALQKAAAAGFGGQLDAYIVHLIATDDVEEFDGPPELSLRGKSREEIAAMIEEGLESGPSTPMTPGDWQALRAKIASQ